MVEMLKAAHERVSDGRLTRAKYEELGVTSGLRYNPDGLLASDLLRSHCFLVSTVTYDWVHTLLQDGVFVIEAALMVKACEETVGVRLEQLAPGSAFECEHTSPQTAGSA